MHKIASDISLKKVPAASKKFFADFGSIGVVSACEAAHSQPASGAPVAAGRDRRIATSRGGLPKNLARKARLTRPAGNETMPNLTINGRSMSVDAANDTPLLWVIREQLQMTGTKFGCGAGLCGACTVHLNGEAVRSCQTSVGNAVGKKITTIEGLSQKGDHPLQKAWIAEEVPQCGYCQSGQIMQAASLLAKNSNPTKEEVVAHMDGNLCRCMTYSRIQKAIMRAAADMRTASATTTERRAT
jgi:isoquinoline 1-oxidoreductase subunit alpha